jgi:ubiquinone/menaquinone biosynthesis C-methylase UbiE
MIISGFDPTSADFERFRALPAAVPAAIRTAVWTALGGVPGGRILDVGAGIGRIGAAFVAARDTYVGADRSAAMLAHFAQKKATGGGVPLLVRADGQALPFRTATFDAVLVVQVLSGLPGWRRLLSEARRVLQAGGALVLGHGTGPEDGIDARMRSQLALVLANCGVDPRRRGGGRDEIRAWLSEATPCTEQVIAARWEDIRSPRDFLNRQRTGARFAALPPAIKQQALHELASWASGTFGGLDVPFREPHAFVLDIAFF